MDLSQSGSVNLNHLYHSLIDLARADIARDYLRIRATKQHGVANVQTDQLYMAIILLGRKELNTQTAQFQLGAGDILIMKPDAIIDAVNIPNEIDGEYLTILVPICEEVIQAAKILWAKPITDKTSELLTFTISDFASQLLAWKNALIHNDLISARLNIASILLQLCQCGYSDILIVPQPNLTKTIYKWVIEAPQRDWQSKDIEMRLGMSGATLRRKLSHEGTSLRETVTHARLAYAIGLLYSSKLPIKTVAAKSGYLSVTAFRERFMQKYAVDPIILSNE